MLLSTRRAENSWMRTLCCPSLYMPGFKPIADIASVIRTIPKMSVSSKKQNTSEVKSIVVRKYAFEIRTV